MKPDLPDSFRLLPEVAEALEQNRPLVALEIDGHHSRTALPAEL